ncbi:MAG TPA: dimethylmenaquinone methyltransferase [Chloroflexi bacterium]|jgi:regulator of RNase E activity RraA|nr:dimethylmenaquinone methyltransferase [Chloroflexota bacterium]HAL27029.1 dimethylmenaquinone methyltransferase [Chloroflexota bacterium]
MAVLPSWLTATLASDATQGRGVVQPGLRPLDPAWRIAAPALVIQASPDDNQAVVTALQASPPAGVVLVVSGHATSRTATIGDIMAADFAAHGVVGLITDGLVRDASEIRKLGFPVWCRGTTPTAPNKAAPGRVGGSVDLGGAVVRDGDIVIADDDGIVIWPREDIEGLVAKADARRRSDAERLAKIRAR